MDRIKSALSIVKEYSAPEWELEGYLYVPSGDSPYMIARDTPAPLILHEESDGGSSEQGVIDEKEADQEWADLVERRRKFWQEWIDLKDDPKAVRVGGNHYWIGDAHISSPINGYSGRWFTVEFIATNRKVRTCDLWHQGKIPPGLKDTLPDNAIFVEGF